MLLRGFNSSTFAEGVLIQWAGCVSQWWLHRPQSSFCSFHSQTRKFPEQLHLGCGLRLVCPAQTHCECNELSTAVPMHCLYVFINEERNCHCSCLACFSLWLPACFNTDFQLLNSCPNCCSFSMVTVLMCGF